MGKMVKGFGLVVSDRSLPDTGEGRGVEFDWPFLVEMTVNLPTNWETYCADMTSSAKRDLRRLRNSELRFIAGDHRAKLAEFYHRHYSPSMISRHGVEAIVQSLEQVEKYFEQGGEYVEVWQGDEWLGGYIGHFDGDTYHYHCVGWKEGAFELRRTGVVSALYLDALKRAIDRGMRYFRMGGVPPFLEDGLLIYKSKWSARLDFERTDFRSWRAMIDPRHPLIRKFFQQNSLIIKNPEKDCFDVIGDKDSTEFSLRSNVTESIDSWRKLASLDSAKTTSKIDLISRRSTN